MIVHLLALLVSILYIVSAIYWYKLFRVTSVNKEKTSTLNKRFEFLRLSSRITLVALIATMFLEGYSFWVQGNSQLIFAGILEGIILFFKFRHIVLELFIILAVLLAMMTSALGSHLVEPSQIIEEPILDIATYSKDQALNFLLGLIHGLTALLAESLVFIILSVSGAGLFKDRLLKKKKDFIFISKLPAFEQCTEYVLRCSVVGMAFMFISIISGYFLGAMSLSGIQKSMLVWCSLLTSVYFIGVFTLTKNDKFSATRLLSLYFTVGIILFLWFFLIMTFYPLSHNL